MQKQFQLCHSRHFGDGFKLKLGDLLPKDELTLGRFDNDFLRLELNQPLGTLPQSDLNFNHPKTKKQEEYESAQNSQKKSRFSLSSSQALNTQISKKQTPEKTQIGSVILT